MTHRDITEALAPYFPGSFSNSSAYLETEVGKAIVKRLIEMQANPVPLTHLNQFLHLTDEAGATDGFFKYYFLSCPTKHPYALEKLFPTLPSLNETGVSSLDQLRWGLTRLYVDSLLYFGNIRTAYRKLRVYSYGDLEEFFSPKRFDCEGMKARGPVLPFFPIPPDDRYLIAEVACKAYSPIGDGEQLLIEDLLLDAYKERGGGRVRIGDLFDKESRIAKNDRQSQMMLEFATEEYCDETVVSEEEIRTKVRTIADRFIKARALAIKNTHLFLSIVNELDVYVATSMRRRSDFREMSHACDQIFKNDGLKRFRTRYFDPTMSAAEGHEDKGLIECLMVKCAKTLVYFAGESDSYGKDAEVAMALSLGRPVIILCPSTPQGEQRMKFFRDIHPLSRLIDMDTGVAVGAMITNDPLTVARLLERIFDNRMEYDLDHNGDGYFRLRERLTKSVVRLQTNFTMLREAFWNYYHGVQ